MLPSFWAYKRSWWFCVLNPLPTIGNSLKKQENLYKVVTPSIKPPYKFLWELITYNASLVGKGLKGLLHPRGHNQLLCDEA